ncbi:TIM barrel protein [Halobacillus litoralis]|uniref:TIM barrel protein n=1 Tax=Halobacillus litoralis TaxID=45668 RepID=UPI001CFEA84E|nr:TIM barrel protein [Halobacillus litoralis]
MTHTLGMSGSTILSNPSQFEELFESGLPHIEIGEFTDREAFQTFMKMRDMHNASFGIHAPLIRGNSKYDLIEEVSMPPEKARVLFEEEVAEAAQYGASYVLVHFPYFHGKARETNRMIEEGLQFLHRLKKTYEIPIVCEPKLGKNQSPLGIQYLYDFPPSLWESYGVDLCIDIGDYIMAAGDQWRTFVEPLLPMTKVVHMHNVQYRHDGYIWVPIHPSRELWDSAYDMRPFLELLASGRDKYFLFEHTPHSSPSNEQVREGIKWVNEIVR